MPPEVVMFFDSLTMIYRKTQDEFRAIAPGLTRDPLMIPHNSHDESYIQNWKELGVDLIFTPYK